MTPVSSLLIKIVTNNLVSEDTCPKRWERIQEFVRTILSTEKETILKAWEKTKLEANFDFDRELENKDVEEEVILQIEMDELMINDEDEATEEDSENIEEPVLFIPPIAAEKKESKQSQITDFFNIRDSRKKILLAFENRYSTLSLKSLHYFFFKNAVCP